MYENGDPTVLPDYTLKKILDTQKGNIADTEFLREEMKMGKTIKCTLSQKSIRKAIDEIKIIKNL